MKKIPTMFDREFGNHKVTGIRPTFTSEAALYALLHGHATVKVDGSCCTILGGVFYKRYDAKKGRKAPKGAIPCCDADPVSGHHPHWVKVDFENPDDKWFARAYRNYPEKWIKDGTFEAVGPHFNGNPYGLGQDVLILHGSQVVFDYERSFEGIKEYLEKNPVEGLVFWVNDEPVCKIKRTDFGLPWPPAEGGWSWDAEMTRLLADPVKTGDLAAQMLGLRVENCGGPHAE